MTFHTFAVSALALAASIQDARALGPFFTTDADPFLGRAVASRTCVIEDMMSALQNSSLQHGAEKDLEEDLAQVADLLRPTFNVLPKNSHDRLSSAGVRYLLHRHFLHHRAWLVKGLAPDGQAWDAAFPMEALASWAPDALQTVVANHLNGRGLTLEECAVLATMLENQVHAEAIEVLSTVWKAYGFAREDSITASMMHTIVSDFVLAYIDGKYLKSLRANDGERSRDSSIAMYPSGWAATEKFVEDVQSNVSWGIAVDGTMGFALGEQIVMRVTHKWGHHHVQECHSLKQTLLNLESKRPGRVDLSAFHASALHGDSEFIFGESSVYLRQLGALDESIASSSSVVIPNYVNSPTNYVARGDLFTVVCIDECEDLFRGIERRIGEPFAEPEEILVAAQSLLSLEGERVDLSEHMVDKLHQVAALHGGRVPLHGRLFALWMHHAYPRDCPYPAQPGTTKPLTPLDYEETTGLSIEETPDEIVEELRDFATKGPLPKDAIGAASLPWDLKEELWEEAVGSSSSMAVGMEVAISLTVFAAVLAVRAQHYASPRQVVIKAYV